MSKQKNKKLQFFYDILMIFLGSILMGIAFSIFLEPNNISTGGFSGLAMIVSSLLNLMGVTFIPTSLIYFVLNMILYFFALKMLGKMFAIKALIGIVFYSLFMQVFDLIEINIVYEPLISSIYGGLIMGIGVGLIVRFGGSTGGSDMIASMVRHKHENFSIGTIVVLVDIVVLLMSLFVFTNGINILPYTIIALAISIFMTDFINDGYKQVKAYYIITKNPDEVANNIMNNLKRGCTLSKATGMYDKTEKYCLTCLISKFQVTALKRIIKESDDSAFVFATNVNEVIGNWLKDKKDIEDKKDNENKLIKNKKDS